MSSLWRHLLALAVAFCLTLPVQAGEGPAVKTTPRAPLALHPLDPPCPFELDSLRWRFDLTGIRHGHVPVQMEAHLTNGDEHPQQARMMLITPDSDARISLKGLGTELQRLVVPYPSEDEPDHLMVPVCIFQVLLMPSESTLLQADISQQFAYEGPTTLAEALRLPDRMLWRRCGTAELEFDLPPHLQLKVSDGLQEISPTSKDAHRVIYQLDLRERAQLRIELSWTGLRPPAVLFGSALPGPFVAMVLLLAFPLAKRGRAAVLAGVVAWGVNALWLKTGQPQASLAYVFESGKWLDSLSREALVIAPAITLLVAWFAWPRLRRQ